MTRAQDVATHVDQIASLFTELSDAIWDEPQVRWEESDAVRRHIELAEKFGFTVNRQVTGIPTAFSAEYGTGGPVIAVLGEYDALAGMSQESGSAIRTPDVAGHSDNGQGCGHHLLGAGSLLAAAALASYLREHGLPGRVRYYGCPAEEAAAGKSYMVKGGAFDDVDSALTWHPYSALVTRQTLTLAYTQVYLRFRGVAAHAGASPHLGRSALDAVELMNVGVNFLREHMTDTSRIHYAITDAGGVSPNVVQARAESYYLVRAPTVTEMRALYARVLKIAEGAALMTETELEVEFDGAASEILPNDVLEEALHRTVESLGGVPFDPDDLRRASPFTDVAAPDELAAERARCGLGEEDLSTLHTGVPALDRHLPRPQMTGSSDVGDVSWVTPVVQVMAPCAALGTPLHSWTMVAQGKLPAAHKGMIHAAKVIAATAAELFTDPDLLARARAEFETTTARRPYDCPIPDGTVPPPLRVAAPA